jgi:hypothetical protein
LHASRSKVQGVGFRVWGPEFGIEGLGFRFWVLGSRVLAFSVPAQHADLGFGLGFGVEGLGFKFWGSGV